jgi:hypothetical protein
MRGKLYRCAVCLFSFIGRWNAETACPASAGRVVIVVRASLAIFKLEELEWIQGLSGLT